jgi:DNA-binding transcriptional ArsR family regulator
MSQSELDRSPRSRSPADPGHAGVDDEDATGEPGEVLSLLSDDYARAILAAIGEDTLPARDVVDRVDASRATVYRRLRRLEAAGLLESAVAFHPDGHHRREFSLARDRMVLSLGSNGVDLDDLT